MLHVAARSSRAVTPASPARPPRAGPPRKSQVSPTRAYRDRRGYNPFARMGVQRAMQPSGEGLGRGAPASPQSLWMMLDRFSTIALVIQGLFMV